MPKPSETKYALGMAKGGVVWWEDGQIYVDLLKENGPVMLIALRGERPLRHPHLARQLFTAFYSHVVDIPFDQARTRLGERVIDPFWDDLASVLLNTRLKKHEDA